MKILLCRNWDVDLILIYGVMKFYIYRFFIIYFIDLILSN